MGEEYMSLVKNGTFTLVELPPGKKTVGAKWVYRIKYDTNGEIAKFKARLMAQGFTQKKGIDFDETYAPVTRLSSVRLLLTIAAAKGYKIAQLDVDSAYLNGFIDKEIYMRQPPGFVDPDHPSKVWLLLKSLYGLKQAAMIWHSVVDKMLRASGYTPVAVTVDSQFPWELVNANAEET